MFTSTLSAMPRAFEGMAGHSNEKEFETKILQVFHLVEY